MTKQPIDNVTLFLLFLMLWPAGCDQRTPKQRIESRESVLNEVMGTTREKTNELPSTPDATSSVEPSSVEPSIVEPSIVKQSFDSEIAKEANKAGERDNVVVTSSSAKPEPKHAPINTVDDPSRPWIGKLELPRETWEVQYLGNNAVGVFYRQIVLTSGGAIRQEADSRMRVSIKGETFEQHVHLTTIEHANGELLSIDGRMEIGPNKQTFQGKVLNEGLAFSGEENGKAFSVSFPWERKCRGPFAVEQSMFRNPLRPRETRRLKYFDPLLRKMIEGRLEASEFSSTPTMLGGSRELLEVRNIGVAGDAASQALLWVDKNGEGFKSYIPANDVLSFRTEPLAAQVVASMSDLRGIEHVSTPLTGDLDQLAKSPKSISYSIKHKSEDPYRYFTDRIGQSLSSIDARSVMVTVFRGGREADLFQFSDKTPSDESGTLSSSMYIPADNARVVERAQAMVAADKSISLETATNLQKANACRRIIQKYISLKDFDKQISLFNSVLRARQANCIEHALFFSAHCRALGIPTRIALGVRFNRSKVSPAMNFHAWIEIREGNRWIPMDASEDLSSTSSTEVTVASIDRLKIKETNFNSPNPFDEILSVVRLLPDLEIKVLPEEKTQ